jgi:catechol 2,3-dioxygenase-like lactoylglutathione lyase family enzyme
MIRHLSGLAEVVEDIESAVSFYQDTLGLVVNFETGNNYADVELPGILHFGLWSREAAAAVILGSPNQSDQIPLGFFIGLEVDSVLETTKQVEENKISFLQTTKKEEWGQVTSRLITPSGVLIELTETPWARKVTQAMEVEPGHEGA